MMLSQAAMREIEDIIALNLQVAGVPYCGMHVNRNSKVTAFEARLQ